MNIQTDLVRSQATTWNSKYLIEKRVVNSESLPLFKHALKQINLSFLDLILDPEVCFEAFFDTFMEIFNSIFPLKSLNQVQIKYIIKSHAQGIEPGTYWSCPECVHL